MGIITISDRQHNFGHRPHKNWRRRLFVGFFLIAGIFAAVVAWAYWRGSSVIRDAIAETDRLDPNWRIEQLEDQRVKIPDEENAALVIAAAKKLIDKSLGNANKEDENDRLLEDLRQHLNARLNAEQLRAIAELLQPYEPAKAAFAKVAAMPRGRFPIQYSADFIGTLLNSQDAREASRYFRLVVNDRISANDAAGAALALKANLFSARSVGDEPFLISALIRIACEAIFFSSLEWTLAQTQLSDATLAELQKLLEEDAKTGLLTLAFRGERAGSFACVEHIKKNPSFMRSVGMITSPAGTGTNWMDILLAYVPGSLGIQQADLLHFMNQAVEISKRPVEEHRIAFGELMSTVPKLSYLARLLCPSVEGITRANLRRHVNLRCAIAAIAAERFRIKFGKWPDQLDELVTAGFLTSVPRDPFDSKPMRWKATGDGRLIYAIGKDGVDNDGNIDPRKNDQVGYDLGFRLFDPNKRGVEPRPSKQPATDSNNGDPP